MAAPTRYVKPHEQLRDLALDARARGLSFEEFWREAIRPGKPIVMVTAKNPPAGAVRWPTDRTDRIEWQRALEGAREGWRRAYEQIPPTASERAVRDLGVELDALELLSGDLEAAGIGG